MTHVKLGLAQYYPKLGDIAHNVDCHLQLMDKFAAQDGQLLVFPELSLTGYYLRDLVAELACKPHGDDPIFGPLLEKTAAHDLDSVIGFVEEDERGRFFVASAYVSAGTVVHVHRKVYLPTYTIFDDKRFFAYGDSVQAFDTRFGRVGMLICEDFWHVSPPYILWQDGADILIFANASPARGLTERHQLASSHWIEMVSQAYAGLFTTYVVQCNRVGFEDGIQFGGGSTVVNPDGDEILHGDYFDEELLVTDLDMNQLRRTRARLPLLRDERPELMARELGRILQQNGQ